MRRPSADAPTNITLVDDEAKLIGSCLDRGGGHVLFLGEYYARMDGVWSSRSLR